MYLGRKMYLVFALSETKMANLLRRRGVLANSIRHSFGDAMQHFIDSSREAGQLEVRDGNPGPAQAGNRILYTAAKITGFSERALR